MTSDWGSLARHLRVAVLAATAGWVTLMSWRVLVVDYGKVAVPLVFVAVLVAGLGATARWRRWPMAVVVPLQAVLAVLFVTWVTTGSALPTPSNAGAMLAALEEAVASSRAYAAPVPLEAAPVHPLLLVGGAGVLVMMDLLVGTLRRAPASGLVLLTAYTVPVTVTGVGVSWWIFVIAAVLFLATVFVQHGDQLAAWGRSPEEDSSAFSVRTGAVASTATALGAAAIALGLVASVVVPTMKMALFEGPGPGTREVEVKNPVVDMRRDLSRGEDIPLLWVRTDGPRPDYLRLSVLTRYLDGRWTPGDRDIPESQSATGELPPLDGVSQTLRREESRHRVEISPAFDSTWLPTTAHVSQINAGPDWRYDTTTRDFIAAEDDVTAARRSYDFTGVRIEPDAEAMNLAVSGVGSVRSIFSEVSPSLDNDIRRLAASITADAPTRYRKAQALQQFFREDGGFRYDVSQAESLGSAPADLRAFLDEDGGRVGYCEQFAASMAIMARVLGIPSRVAVGFLEPERADDGSWEYSAHDLHAWPELFFPGAGWVRFEPTPSDRAAQAPGYTTVELEQQDPSASPSANPTDELVPDRGADSAVEDAAAEEDATSLPWGRIVLALLGTALVVALLLAPRLVRRSRRQRALGDGVEGIWAELRATMVDLGHSWPHGRSPRRTGEWVGRFLAAPDPTGGRSERPRRGRGEAPEAAQALDRLVGAVERSRYAPAGAGTTDGLHEDAETVLDALRCGVTGRVQRRAEWWPRSVVGTVRRRPRRAKNGDGATPAVERVEELVG